MIQYIKLFYALQIFFYSISTNKQGFFTFWVVSQQHHSVKCPVLKISTKNPVVHPSAPCLFVYLSVFPSFKPSDCPSIHQPTPLHPSIHLSIPPLLVSNYSRKTFQLTLPIATEKKEGHYNVDLELHCTLINHRPILYRG